MRFLYYGGNMAKQYPPKLKEKVPPEQRLALEQNAQSNMQVARRLLNDKNYKEAFKQFKHALVTAEGTDIFPRSAEMAELARNYRPALAALKRWRIQKERLILAQTADSKVISQWETLNDCLNEKDRSLTVFRKLQAAGADEDLLNSFYWKLWRRLVKEKGYEDLRPFFNTLGWLTLSHVSDHHAEKWFPSKGSYVRTHEKIIKDGALVYETAIALQKYDSAKVIVDKLLSVEDTDATYAALITAARRARARDEAKALYQQARERLGAHRVRKSTKALGPLAKPGRRAGQSR
jgi:hypothetical protein